MIHSMRRLRKGAHLEKPRRRWLAWGIGILILMIAAVAVALLISNETTGEQTFSAESIGNVDIGNATEGIYTVDLTDLATGTTLTACVGAQLVDPIEGDDPRIYAATVTGDLADDIEITVAQHETQTDGAESTWGIGRKACNPNGTYAVFFSGTFAAFKAAHGDYGNGIPWTNNNEDTSTDVRFIVELPDTLDAASIAGDEAVLSVAFENQGGS